MSRPAAAPNSIAAFGLCQRDLPVRTGRPALRSLAPCHSNLELRVSSGPCLILTTSIPAKKWRRDRKTTNQHQLQLQPRQNNSGSHHCMTNHCATPAEIERAIRNIPDFPKAGIQFKDITPVLADPRLFCGSIDLLTDGFKPGSVDAVVGIDARGFIF